MIIECPGSKIFKQPQPENIKCPNCYTDVEIWTDEIKAKCQNCGKVVLKERTQSCLDWCKHARDCMGGGSGMYFESVP